MKRLTAAQEAALARVNEHGYLGPGNGVAWPTIKALALAGHVVLYSGMTKHYRRPGWAEWHHDWIAYRPDVASGPPRDYNQIGTVALVGRFQTEPVTTPLANHGRPIAWRVLWSEPDPERPGHWTHTEVSSHGTANAAGDEARRLNAERRAGERTV